MPPLRSLCSLAITTALASCVADPVSPVAEATSASLIADEVYISRANQLFVVDGPTGTAYRLNSDMPNAVAMASAGGNGYLVLENTTFPAQQALYTFTASPILRRLTPFAPGTTWPATDAMAALSGSLYVVSDGSLWRVDVASGATVPFSAYPNGWAGTDAMAALGTSLYVVQAGTLYRVSTTTGAVVPFSAYPSGWAGTEAMTATGDSLYAVQAGTLWRVNVNTGAVAPFSAYPNGWAGTAAMTARGGVVYAVQAGALWTVNTASGSVAQLGSLSWTGTTAMAARL
jgi:hypothetical protein